MSNENFAAMQVFPIPVDSTATWYEGTIMLDGSALDVSGATGDLYYHARDEDGNAIITAGVAEWTTDGTDGKIRFQLVEAVCDTVRDVIVGFEIQGYDSGNIKSECVILRFYQDAKGS